MKILHLDTNHSLLIKQLNALGYTNHENYESPKSAIVKIIGQYDGVIIRSRFSIDKSFIDHATQLKFIARVGAGLENIDIAYAEKSGIQLIAAPEGNRTAVGEHSLAMLLSLFNKLQMSDMDISSGNWRREIHRGHELNGKTIGIIGYGNMGKAFAKTLQGFAVRVLCHDLKPNVGDDFATQVSLEELKRESDVVSLHTPHTEKTKNMINSNFIKSFDKPFWLINTARGSAVVTKDLVSALKSNLILGAGLDVLEYEKASFENLFSANNIPAPLAYLMQASNVIMSPHVAGWTVESHAKLAQTIVNKIKLKFHNIT